MNAWLKVSIVFVTVMLIRSLISFIKYRRLVNLHKEYRIYVMEGGEEFPKRKIQIVGLFKESGVKDFTVAGIQPAGYGKITKYQTSGFANLTTRLDNVVPIIDLKFMEAIGEFKLRAQQSVNPLFWLELLLKLPQFLLGYFNVKPKNLAVKIIQVIYWFFGIVAALDAMGAVDVSVLFGS